MSKEKTRVRIKRLSGQDSFDPLFNLLLESNITFRHSYLFGNQIALIIDQTDLLQLQNLITSGFKYCIKSVQNIQPKSPS